MKRVFDFVASFCGAIVLAPLFLIIATTIKLDSPGPVFFRQKRVGRGGRHFQIFKFRTMVDGAARRGRSFTVKGDARVTSAGRWLRCTKLDELPQLLNVILGEMSLVGPRPEVPEFVDLFWDDYADILKYRPGITHRASIIFRNEEELLSTSDDPERFYRETIMPHKLQIYSDSAESDSLAEDLRTIIETVLSVTRHCSAKEMVSVLEASAGATHSTGRSLQPLVGKVRA